MLDLYVSETCPYCKKVTDYFDELGILYHKRSVSEPGNLNMLLKRGGKAQVPFLDDIENGTSMYESDDIIEYVKNRGQNVL